MPALSSTMTEGKIVSWLKQPGDKITKGESVVVVESDKADMDVESFSEGFLGGIVVEEGGMANVGAPQISSQAVTCVPVPDTSHSYIAQQAMRTPRRWCRIAFVLPL